MRFRLVEEQIDYNANPWDRNEGDCAIRALSLAYDKNYNQIKSELNSVANKNNSKFNYIDTIETLIYKYGYDEIFDAKEKSFTSLTVDRFLSNHRNGTYVIFCGNNPKESTSNSFHLVTSVDGKIYDTWDSSNYYVIKAYKIRHYNRTVRNLKDESLNEELKKLSNDIIVEYAKNILPQGNIHSKRAFILPDGSILDVVNKTHDKSSLFVCDELAKDGYDIDTFINQFDNCTKQELLDRIGFLHVNSQNEDYILLPPVKITRKQSFTLGDWIENFYKETEYRKPIIMMAYNLNTLGQVDAVKYSPNDYDGEEVASRAIRYYNTGKLFEEVSRLSAIDFVRKHFKMGNPGPGNTYIDTNGSFINLYPEIDTHEDMCWWLEDNGYEDCKNEESEEWAVANWNWIRCRQSLHDCSITLPTTIPTREQFYSLEEWMEEQVCTDVLSVSVAYDSSKSSPPAWNDYNTNDYYPEDIIKLIKRYYSSGKLYENILKEN